MLSLPQLEASIWQSSLTVNSLCLSEVWTQEATPDNYVPFASTFYSLRDTHAAIPEGPDPRNAMVELAGRAHRDQSILAR